MNPLFPESTPRVLQFTKVRIANPSLTLMTDPTGIMRLITCRIYPNRFHFFSLN